MCAMHFCKSNQSMSWNEKIATFFVRSYYCKNWKITPNEITVKPNCKVTNVRYVSFILNQNYSAWELLFDLRPIPIPLLVMPRPPL